MILKDISELTYTKNMEAYNIARFAEHRALTGRSKSIDNDIELACWKRGQFDKELCKQAKEYVAPAIRRLIDLI
jgi:hypothetical protein